MSDLSRLRELAALFQPPKPVVEASTGSKALSSIKGEFENAMDTMHDMFDRGGRVEQALAKVKDLDKDMQLVKDLGGVTADYKKKVMKLLDEADIMLSEDTDPDPVNEADLSAIVKQLKGEFQDMVDTGNTPSDRQVTRTIEKAMRAAKIPDEEHDEAFEKIYKQLNEGRRNHMDEMEYETIPGWKRALKQKYPEVWYHPDDGTIDAFVGPKPFKNGETKQVGHWDDTVGTIN